ncbi:MAG: type I DNA topoisomerase [Caldiserica bacterium]|nr:type I DNA topoisomerase [Caldisericota bacterium]
MKRVVIVESPTKARTIGQYLGRGYLVLSSKGHVRDLPERELGVDVARGFVPKWVVKNRKLIRELKKAVADAARVYLATDPDREGEAIAFDLMELLADGNRERFARILLHEITPQAVKAALESPGEIDLRKVEAQRTRRILDRLVGYEISPLLSRVLAGSKYEGLSAGRVQSVALRFICDRELEIQEFVPEPFWEIEVEFATEPAFTAKLKGKVKDPTEVERIKAELARAEFRVAAVEEKEIRRKPPAPFITSTLQQAASSELGFSPSRTMRVAQELYEGVEIGGKSVGLITYMRTDSVRVSETAIAQARGFIGERFGKEYLAPRPRIFKNKRRSQDAHEAIRPTDVSRTPDEVGKYLTPDQRKLYELIWRRFLATQMADGIWKRYRVILKAGDHEFVASTSFPVFKGFAEVLRVGKLEDEGNPLPGGLVEGTAIPVAAVVAHEKHTEPPKRYTEGSLVKKLEQEGVGRPSTYAQIVSVIQERGYVVKEKGALRPTLLGFIVADFLREYFPETVQESFTAEMEASLDRIQEGELEGREVLERFYASLSERLRAVRERMDRGERAFVALTDVPCPECGAPMEVRVWKGSLYLGCSRYPECKTTRPLPPRFRYRYRRERIELAEGLAEASEGPEVACPKCGAAMEVKHGRYGRYLACPACGHTMPIPTGVECPACGVGELVERFSRKNGRTFYACSNYPECRFTLPGRPIGPCGGCGKGVLYEDPRKGLACSNPKCENPAAVTPQPAS